MQNIIVFLAVIVALIFTGLRLWKTLVNPKNISCGCGCSGCGSESNCSPAHKSLPRYKP